MSLVSRRAPAAHSRDTEPVTNRQPTTRLGWWRFLLAAIAAALVTVLGAGTASAVTAPNLETRRGLNRRRTGRRRRPREFFRWSTVGQRPSEGGSGGGYRCCCKVRGPGRYRRTQGGARELRVENGCELPVQRRIGYLMRSMSSTSNCGTLRWVGRRSLDYSKTL